MQFGAVLPVTEIGNDTGAVKAWAQAAEEIGYDRIITYDHVLGGPHDDRQPALTGPYTEHDPFREPMVLFGYLAGVTTRVELMPGVLILPQRQTALVAKQAVEIDLLSGGRFVLGVGTGWNWIEYESLNEEFTARGRRFEEQITLLRRLWAEPVVDFRGHFHRIDRAGLLPLPERMIPIWFGGASDIAMTRAAAMGDGFYFMSANSRGRAALDSLRAKVDGNGRDAATFPAAGQVHLAFGFDAAIGDAAGWKSVAGSHLFVTTLTSSATSGATSAEQTRCETVDDHIALLQRALDALRAL
ncbi:MAG TPA: LLM class F420-dependent oxidoreductase [Ilumatobacteraceae bacterium]